MIVDPGNVGAALRRLAIPAGVQMLGDQLLGVADTIAIGSLGAQALAGATAAGTLFIVLVFVVAGFLSGLSIVAAQRVGANDLDGFARTVRSGAMVPLAAAALFALASLALARPAMHGMLGAMPSANAGAWYLTLRCFSLVPIAISGTAIAGMTAAGNPRLGIVVLALINIVHIPLLLVLCLGWWTHHPFGVVGAGVSSLISEALAAAYALVYVARRPVYRILRDLRIDWNLALRCARLGLPESVFLAAVTLPDVFIVAMLAPLGASIVAGFRALGVVSDLTFVIPSPMQSAVQTVVGQRLGARDVENAREFLRRAQRVTFALTTATGALFAGAAWPLAYLFTLNAPVATIAALPLAAHMLTLPIKGYAMVSMAPIRASGDTRFSMAMGLLCGALVLPCAWFAIERLHAGLYAVPIGWIAAWSARAAITAFKLRHGAWERSAPLTV